MAYASSSSESKTVLREARALLRRLLRGRLVRYTTVAGTSTRGDALLALRALLNQTPLLDGPDIAAYERRFAALVGARYAYSFAAGRMALYALLEALDIGPGNEVILPAYTCVVVPNAILYRGAQPVYVDIDPRTFNIDAGLVAAKITPRTKAIIAQHTFGLPSDVERINRIARQHGLYVLEDCAHALGAAFQGQQCGSLATAAYFSTDRTKIINTGTGGMVTTNDPALAAKIADIYQRATFLSRDQVRMLLLAYVLEFLLLHPRTFLFGKYIYSVLARLGLRHAYFRDELSLEKPRAYPYPARLSNTQARIGLSQLAKLPDQLAWRRRAAGLYEAVLNAFGGLVDASQTNHVFLRYAFLVQDRDAWVRFFDDALEMGPWFTSIAHGRDDNLADIGYQQGSCPVAEAAAAHCVNLPTHPRISDPVRLARLLEQSCRSASSGLRRVALPASKNSH